MNAETRARLHGYREGILRNEVESPFKAVRRFRELQKEAREAREASDRSKEKPPYGIRILGWLRNADSAHYAAGFSGRIAKGPGLKRTIVFMDSEKFLRIPLGEARRPHYPKRQTSR